MNSGTTVAFVGLGVMGYPMAGHLQAAGHATQVYNRTTQKAVDWAQEHGGGVAETPREAADGAAVVFLCVGADDDVRSVVEGDDGVLAAMEAGSVLVDHTTASAELARELDTLCRESGIGFVDAPVSGGQAGAENGVLTVMCGGDFSAPTTVSEDHIWLTLKSNAANVPRGDLVIPICGPGATAGANAHVRGGVGVDDERCSKGRNGKSTRGGFLYPQSIVGAGFIIFMKMM